MSSALVATFAASGRAARAKLRACATERNRLSLANAELVCALRDTLARFDALRKAVHESSSLPSLENIQYRFNLHLDRAGIQTETEPAIEAARAALAKATP